MLGSAAHDGRGRRGARTERISAGTSRAVGRGVLRVADAVAIAVKAALAVWNVAHRAREPEAGWRTHGVIRRRSSSAP